MAWKPINTSRKKNENEKTKIEIKQERPQPGDTVKYSDREYTVGEGGEFRRKNPKV